MTIAGVPIGKEIPGSVYPRDTGSIIIVIATDAPLLPNQLKRLARRASLGLARTGSISGNGSGDLFIAFSTANPNVFASDQITHSVQTIPNDLMDPLFSGTVQATEEAIVNALVDNHTMIGADNHRVEALPHEKLRRTLEKVPIDCSVELEKKRLENVVTIEADELKNILTVRYSGSVRPAEVERGLEEMGTGLERLRSGFRLLADLTALESMDVGCAPFIEKAMDLCNEKGASIVVRVIPDPHRDIGMQIMSIFHSYGSDVQIVTCETFAEAIKMLGP